MHIIVYSCSKYNSGTIHLLKKNYRYVPNTFLKTYINWAIKLGLFKTYKIKSICLHCQTVPDFT